MRDVWTSFAQLQDQTNPEILLGDTGLPVGFDAERLLLNTNALRRGLIGLGGLETVILSGYRGDSDTTTMNGTLDSSGTGTVAGVATAAAEPSTSSTQNDAEKQLFNIRNGVAALRWNINALNSRATISDQYDPVVRAKQLNKIVKNESIRTVTQHNIHDVIQERGLGLSALTLSLDSLRFAPEVYAAVNGEYTEFSMGMTLGVFTMRMVSVAIPLAAKLRGDDVSFSDMITDYLFFTARPTRAVAASGYLATQRLVKAV